MTLSGCGIKSVKAVWEEGGTKKIYTVSSNTALQNALFTMSEDGKPRDIPSGIYEVTFSFYNDATQQDEVHKLFSCTHSLNVYQNLTTGRWKSSTAGATYISDGKFTLTQEIINGYIRHKFYVNSTSTSTLEEGTWYAPFKSVRTAVEKICSINDGEPFTVTLLSHDTDESAASYTSGNKSYIDIANTSLPLAVTILGKDGDDNDTLRTINAALTADRTGSVMYIGENAAVTLKNIHITGGYSSYNTGSGIINKGTLTMEDCTVSGCIATHCGGGGIGNFGTLSMNTCTVSDCTAEISGGAIFSNGTLTVKDCTISSCEADWGGGGISNGKTGTLTVIGGSISLCKGGSSSGGGGIYSQGTLTVTGCTISGNESYNGGGIRSDVSDASVTVSITDCEITCSTTGGKGVGISNKGPLTVTGCTIICDGTSGTSGSGIYNEGGTADIPVTVTDCTISGRKRVAYGGGIYNTGTLIVTGGTISSCEATKGGGIWNGGTLTVSGTSISSCKATGYSDSCGGAIFSNGGETAAVLTVEGSTKISGCTAAKIGGGVYILNSTFTISGSASITSETGAAKDNDVYLASGKTITVKGTLTAESPVATISLDDGEYTADRQVLQAPDGGAITSDICEKFAVAQDPNGIEWKVAPDGTGTKGVLRNSTLYVRGAGAGWYTENPGYNASAASDTNSGSKSAPFATIQKALAAVDSMNDGTSEYTIYVDGTITGGTTATANGMGDISPTKALSLKIQSMSETTNATLDAEGSGRVLYINANAAVTLKNVNIANGTTADNGGGISNEGLLTIDGGAITNCTTAEGKGGGIYNSGTLTMEGGSITNCTANTSTSSGGDGGGIYNNVTDASITCTIIDCTITGCKATGSSSFDGIGGGIYNKAGTLKLTNVNITGGGDIANPDAKNNGGGICNGGTLTIEGGKIKDCVSGTAGGIINSDGTLTCTGVTVENCIARGREGGGIENYETGASGASPAIATLTDCTISGCKTLATEYRDYRDGGGGINNQNGTLTLSGGRITGCSSIVGGGITNIGGKLVITGGAEISGNKIEGSTAENNGGGIKIQSGNVTLENGTISDNEAVHWGGGVYVAGTSIFTMKNGTVSGNTAKSGGGIGIWSRESAGNVTITGGTITNNTVSEYGGGVYNLGTLIQNGGEISNNTAACGGGVHNANTYVIDGRTYDTIGKFTMSGGTITSNTATTDETATPNGGGVCFESGSFTMSGGENQQQQGNVCERRSRRRRVLKRHAHHERRYSQHQHRDSQRRGRIRQQRHVRDERRNNRRKYSNKRWRRSRCPWDFHNVWRYNQREREYVRQPRRRRCLC